MISLHTKIFLLSLICLLAIGMTPQTQAQTPIQVSEDLKLVPLSENTYLHISYTETQNWGRVASNGMIYVQGEEAFLFDTPMSMKIMEELIAYIEDSLGLKLVGFVPNHFHEDCTTGLELLHEKGVQTYSHEMTRDLSRAEESPTTQLTFQDSVNIHFGNTIIKCDYLGGGHAKDNIVVWLPAEKILFAGCMCRSMASKSKGNTADADLEEWPKTIKKVLKKYADAEVVIPGHGAYGGLELLEHTLEIVGK